MSLHEELKRLFPWLGSDEPVSGADVVDALVEAYVNLKLPKAKINGRERKFLECPKCGCRDFIYLEDISNARDIEFRPLDKSKKPGKLVVKVQSVYTTAEYDDGDNARLKCEKCHTELAIPNKIEIEFE